MSKISRILEKYTEFIATPWRENTAAAQRVIFCVYTESEELKMRTKYDEFELATRGAGHNWARFDLSHIFAEWLSSQKYANSYFEKPDLLASKIHKYQDFILEKIRAQCASSLADSNCVLAISGVGSLFGFLKVKDLVDKLAPMVSGRFLVFFPGSYENNNFRLLDGYDGWNYLAVRITPDGEHI